MSLTSVIRRVKAIDTSAIDGSGKAELEFEDITASYGTDVAAETALTTEDVTTLGTYEAPTDAAHIRIKRISDSDPLKGQLEIHFHDDQLMSGSKLWLSLSASGALFAPLELDLYNDAAISSRSTFAAGQQVDLIDVPNSAALDEISATVEEHILDEGDGEAVLQAIVDKINSVDADLSGLSISAIAQAVRDVNNASPASNSLGAAINSAVTQTTAAAIRGDIGLANASLDSQLGTLATASSLTTVGSNVSTLLSRIPSALFSGITSLAQWLGLIAGKQAGSSTARTELRATGAGSGTYDETTDSQESLRDRGDAAWTTGSGGGLSGAYSLALTVNDGSTPIQGAKVRLTLSGTTGGGSTDEDGLFSTSIDSGVWTVTITAPGYVFAPVTLDITGNTTHTYGMTASAITPSDAGETTGYLVCLDEAGEPLEGVQIEVQAKGPSTAATGTMIAATKRTEASDVNGLVQFTGLVANMRYLIRPTASASAEWSAFEIGADPDPTTPLPSLVG